MKMKKQGAGKRFFVVVFALILGISSSGLIGIKEVQAAGHTQTDAVNWAKAQVGKGLDYDRTDGNQCVDLIKYYYAYFGVAGYATGNANAYISNNALPGGWTRVYGGYQPGDIAVWKVNHSCNTCKTSKLGHVGIIISVDSGTFNAVNQNFANQAFCTTNRFNISALACAIRPKYEAARIPQNPKISKNQVWYDIKDKIELTASAEGATSYFMSMFKDEKKIVSQSVPGGKYTFNASAHGYGEYKAYFSCTNSAGTVDTKWIDFSVVKAPGYSSVSASNWWYDLSDTVTLNVATVCAKGQTVHIEKEGKGKVVSTDSPAAYKIAASKLGLGKYSAYFTVRNGSGTTDTKKVTFEIVDAPKKGAVVSTAKPGYTLDDTVQISVLVYCTKEQTLYIDKIGAGRIITKKLNNAKYTVAASQLGRGKYSAYFTVKNNSGGYDTSKIEFAIDNNLIEPSISVEKKDYALEEDIIFTSSVKGGAESSTLKIYDQSGKEVAKKDFIGKQVTINGSSLGSGVYTAKVSYSNYAFQADTEPVSFQVDHTVHSYIASITKTASCTSEGVKIYKCPCGASYIEAIAKTAHVWDEGRITEGAAGADGVCTYTCISCGITKTEKIPASEQGGTSNKPSDEQGGTSNQPAGSGTEDGNHTSDVDSGEENDTSNGSKEEDGLDNNTPPVHQHAYKIVKTVKPTYTSEGYTLKECDCGRTVKTNIKAKLILKSPVVKAAAGKKKVDLSWKKIKGASGYKIYMKASPKGKYKCIKTLKAIRFTKTRLISKKKYYFAIKAYKKVSGKTVYSKPVYKTVKVK